MTKPEARAPGGRPAAADPVIARTRRRLLLVTLGLVGTLVLAIGAASTFVALRALDQDIDRSLERAAEAAMARFSGDESGSPGEHDDSDDDGHDRESPAATPAATPAPEAERGDDEPVTADSDTFYLVLDASGAVALSPSGYSYAGLPDAAAVTAARAGGSDIRTIQPTGGRPIRVLTLPIEREGSVAGFLQAGYILVLHDQQSRSLILAILGVGLIGLAGAALVTYWVVGRALVPIRSAFATERRFVADASHEIRTPAAIIRSSAEVLEREGLVSDAGRPLVDGIVAEADRLGRLVDDMLALAASEQGTLSVDRRAVDFAEVVRSTVARTLPLAQERGVTLAGPADGGTAGQATPPLPVSGDPERLTQVLLVLLDNAFRHSPVNGCVTVTAVRAGRRAEVHVDDQGPGVPPAARRQIFEPFARLPDARRRADKGAGLGLAIASRLVELHGGTLEVSDAPGGGARFTISLPLA